MMYEKTFQFTIMHWKDMLPKFHKCVIKKVFPPSGGPGLSADPDLGV